MISNLLAGYLLLLQQGTPADAPALDAHQLDLIRRHFALAQLSLPRDEFPNLVESAEDTAEVWLTDPNDWWGNTVDLITFGLERMLERSREGSGSSKLARRRSPFLSAHCSSARRTRATTVVQRWAATTGISACSDLAVSHYSASPLFPWTIKMAVANLPS